MKRMADETRSNDNRKHKSDNKMDLVEPSTMNSTAKHACVAHAIAPSRGVPGGGHIMGACDTDDKDRGKLYGNFIAGKALPLTVVQIITSCGVEDGKLPKNSHHEHVRQAARKWKPRSCPVVLLCLSNVGVHRSAEHFKQQVRRFVRCLRPS